MPTYPYPWKNSSPAGGREKKNLVSDKVINEF
jgi:hypothetical protein